MDTEETDSEIDILDDSSELGGTASSLGDSSSRRAIEKRQLQTVPNSDVQFHVVVSEEETSQTSSTTTTMSTPTPDITKPLIIQTRFGNLPPGPGTGSSTDTASEVGSGVSSPIYSTGEASPLNCSSAQSSPMATTAHGDARKSADKLQASQKHSEDGKEVKVKKAKYNVGSGFSAKVRAYVLDKFLGHSLLHQNLAS